MGTQPNCRTGGEWSHEAMAVSLAAPAGDAGRGAADHPAGRGGDLAGRSVLAVRFLNAHFGESTPLLHDPFEQYFMDRDKLYFNDSAERYFKKPS
jgi:hypothetical protein